MRRRLVITADDFGMATEVNQAVEIAHVDGVLSSASLMVGAAAAPDAIARARRLPRLRVGLHLTLLEGDPILGRRRIPDLVGADGRLRNDAVRLAIDLARSASIRNQLREEIEAQFEAFRRTGLRLDHVNAHKHFHLHPIILADLLTIARRFGARALRIPVEPVSLIRQVEAGSVGLPAAILEAHARLLRIRVRRSGFLTPDAVFGLSWSGAFTLARLVRLLDHLPPGFSEIYFHPATIDTFPGCARGYRYREELAALSAPEIAAQIDAAGPEVGGYSDVADATVPRQRKEKPQRSART
jgi:chitin disaccharide deacetylase